MYTERSYEILEQTLCVIPLAGPLIAAIQRKDRDLASQVRRALSSVAVESRTDTVALGNGE